MANDSNDIKAKKRATADERSENVFLRIYRGKFLHYDFFKKHFLATIVIVIMIVMSTANKYSYQLKVTEIKTLEAKLQVERANCFSASATYNSLIREASMKQLVDTMHIDLILPEKPAYNLAEYE